MIELRDYQKDLLERVRDALASSSAKIMLQLPTGGGKTLIAGKLLSGWLNDGRKAVWLTHRKELADQTKVMLGEADVPAATNISWDAVAPTIANGVVILMAQTVSRRNITANVWGGYTHTDLMIIDEAHHATADGWERAIRQWPGPVLGMTATPWRLSVREGFDHLFDSLLAGPQVADLQQDGWLCNSRVVLPGGEQLIQGGPVNNLGDYSERGIELANEDRDVWTAGAFRFWQEHCADRQTVVYAVSVAHAHRLRHIFNEAGIPVGVLLGDTPNEERSRLIESFKDGTKKALINVAVATEGFDLPDAACVVLTRPTKSLSLYLQMVGRGLRQKQNDEDCIILDLAGNSLLHGLPGENRQWSLLPRGEQPSGGSPVVLRCPECESVSPAGSHECTACGAPFGEHCGRCGAWRAWKRWSRKTECGQAHDLVCDRCHEDAHVQASLPVTEDLKEVALPQYDDELPTQRDPFLKNLLEEERFRVVSGAEKRKEELRLFVENRRSELADDNELDRLFENHIDTLPPSERPQTQVQRSRRFTEWEGNLKQEVAEWERELTTLTSQPVDGQRIFNNARDRLLGLFEAEAREAGLLPKGGPVHDSRLQAATTLEQEAGPTEGVCSLPEWNHAKRGKPARMIFPDGKERVIGYQYDIELMTTEWLIEKDLLVKSSLPIRRAKRFLVALTPVHPDGKPMTLPKKVSWAYVEGAFPLQRHIENAQYIIEHAGQDPAHFSFR